ncbi:MAG: hypothetical protein ABSF51_12745, partial [Verrucomicrobiota bacterium]
SFRQVILTVASCFKISETKNVQLSKTASLTFMNKFRKSRNFLGTIGDKKFAEGCGNLRFGVV